MIVTADPQTLVVETNYTQQTQEVLIDPNFLLRFYKYNVGEADFRLMRLVLEKMNQANPSFDLQSFDDELEELAQAAADVMTTVSLFHHSFVDFISLMYSSSFSKRLWTMFFLLQC